MPTSNQPRAESAARMYLAKSTSLSNSTVNAYSIGRHAIVTSAQQRRKELTASRTVDQDERSGSDLADALWCLPHQTLTRTVSAD